MFQITHLHLKLCNVIHQSYLNEFGKKENKVQIFSKGSIGFKDRGLATLSRLIIHHDSYSVQPYSLASFPFHTWLALLVLSPPIAPLNPNHPLRDTSSQKHLLPHPTHCCPHNHIIMVVSLV